MNLCIFASIVEAICRISKVFFKYFISIVCIKNNYGLKMTEKEILLLPSDNKSIDTKLFEEE